MNILELIEAQNKVVIQFEDNSTLVTELRKDEFHSFWSTTAISGPSGELPVENHLRYIFIAPHLIEAMQKAIDAKYA